MLVSPWIHEKYCDYNTETNTYTFSFKLYIKSTKSSGSSSLKTGSFISFSRTSMVVDRTFNRFSVNRLWSSFSQFTKRVFSVLYYLTEGRGISFVFQNIKWVWWLWWWVGWERHAWSADWRPTCMEKSPLGNYTRFLKRLSFLCNDRGDRGYVGHILFFRC